MPLTQAAQAVQVSAFPNAYAKWSDDALHLVEHVGSGLIRAIPDGLEQCPGNLGWLHPVPGGTVTSGYRTAERPSHDGVDLGVGRGTLIRAASAGQVIRVRCNAIDRRDGSDWGCDRDGDANLTAGCGWFVELLHVGNVMTRYCHMNAEHSVKEGDEVVAGQTIGVVGSTGHSSGPHVHFEVHLNADRNGNGAPVDPVPFMRERLAPLDQSRV